MLDFGRRGGPTGAMPMGGIKVGAHEMIEE
jgi:hypothetical protein